MWILWVKAPLLLRRHPSTLLAVFLTSATASLAAAAPPLVRAGIQSESLKRQVETMTPLLAGFEVWTQGGPIGSDRNRRRAAGRLRKHESFLGRPVLSSLLPMQLAAGPAVGLAVVALARTGAVGHVRQLTKGAGHGAWIADTIASQAHLRPGDTLRLTRQSFGGAPVARVRVAGIFRTLEADRDNPYWANWQQDIRSPDPDSPPPPPFVLMSEPTFVRVAEAVASDAAENRSEFPIDPSRITLPEARRLQTRLNALENDITRAGSRSASSIGCGSGFCRTTSSLSAALTIAVADVAAVAPVISLLSSLGIAISLALSFAAGLFLVRRRADEAYFLFTRGEAPAAFAARTAVEAFLPAAVGVAAGVAAAVLSLEMLAPRGTLTGDIFADGARRAATAGVAPILFLAAGAASGVPRPAGAAPWLRRLRRLPWEAVPLALAATLLTLVFAGMAMTSDVTGTRHPRLAVFVLPLVVVVGCAGVAVRAARRLLRRSAHTAVPAVFLAVRRLAAARGLLVAVTVTSATAFGTFAYSLALSASLDRSTSEKAYVSNGSDVQGFIDPHARVTSPFSFPVALVQVDDVNVAYPTGARVDLIAGDPRALARTLRWGDGWANDPRPLLTRLVGSPAGMLAAIATPGAPSADSIDDQGKRIPIRIVGHAAVPGSKAGRPALLVSWPALRRIAARLGILDPGPQATGLVWAKGSPRAVEPALARSALLPFFLTPVNQIYAKPSVGAARRSYRYVRLIGAAAAVLSLLALLLYLQARQRSQSIASALVRRMGLGRVGDAAAIALEAAAIAGFAAVTGTAAAAVTAGPVARRLDPLPQYAPSPVFVIPWHTLAIAAALATVVAGILGAAAAALAQNADVAEALRVA